jgi:iron complex outermembrane receptor protein
MKGHSVLRGILMSGAAFSVTFAASAYAASEPGTADSATSTSIGGAAEPQATAETSNLGDSRPSATLEDIIVTARRRDESLQSVPIAISAFSQQALTERSIANALDLNKAVPGLAVQADNGSATIPNFSIRGRGQSFGAASGSVETYFAEIPLSAPFQRPTLPAQFFDLQSVQVLKGPMGTLFGRNSTGGAVLFVPQAPILDSTSGYVRAQVGNYSNVQAEGAVNIPIATDKAALRIAGFGWHRKGYMRTVGGRTDYFGRVLPSQRYNNQDVLQLRASLLLNPSDNISNTTILTYHTDENRGTPKASHLRPGFGFPTSVLSLPKYVADVSVDLDRRASSTWAVINTTTIELSDTLTLKNIFGHIHSKSYTSYPQDTDGTFAIAIDNVPPPNRSKNYQTTEELQLQGTTLDGRFTWILGGLIDLTRNPGGNDINTLSTSASLSPPFPGVTQNWLDTSLTSKSLFASGTVTIVDRLNLTLGGRHTWDKVKDESILVFTPATAVPNFLQQPPANAPIQTLKNSFKGWTYNIGLDYRVSDDTMIYGGFRRGYKRGGFNTNPPTPALALFGPEINRNIYLGVKTAFDLGDVRGRFNIEGFYDRYKGAQRVYLAFTPTGLATVTDNVPLVRYQGFDADLTLDLSRWLTFTGNYTFVDADNLEWPDTTVPGMTGDQTVNPVSAVSRHKLSATARFHADLSDGSEIAFAPTVSYQSRYFATDNAVRIPNSVALIVGQVNMLAAGANVIPGYTLVDLRAEWNKIKGSNLSLALNATNLTNKYYSIGNTGIYFFGAQGSAYGAPRMFTAVARFTF